MYKLSQTSKFSLAIHRKLVTYVAQRHKKYSSLRPLLLLGLLSPFAANTGNAQVRVFLDAAAVQDIYDTRNYDESPATAESPKSYIIGNTAAFDTDFDTKIFLDDYTDLLIQNGSAAPENGDDIYLSFEGNNSTVTVTGANTELLLRADNTTAQSLQFRSGSNNSLQVLNGAYVTAGRVGNTSVGVSILIDGTNSRLTTLFPRPSSGSDLTIDISNGGIWETVGFFGGNGILTLNINDGGSFQSEQAFDATSSSVDNFNFNSGGTLIGLSSISNLSTIQSGRTVDISNGGSFGTATTLNGGTVSAADFGLTNLTFTSGTIASSGVLTNLPELLSGRSVDITNGGSLGDATTLNGGTVTTGDFGLTNLTFTSGTIAASGVLTNLPELTSGRSVDITNGGSLGDATILNGGNVTAGDFGLTNLTFTSGAIASSGVLTNLPELTSGHNVNLSSGGSLGDATTLNGGSLTTDDFDTTNLTFTSGSLTTTGALTNLNSLSSANQNVVIDGGTWNPSGNIDTGNLTIQNNGTTTVSHYSATNLTLTSSTLIVTGGLTNLNTLSSANQNVVIDGGNWTPLGNIDAGNLTIQNNGTTTVSDYNATNLTLTSGTLIATGGLANLNTLSSANQNVVIDSGTWSPSGNIDAGNLTIQNAGSVTVSIDYDATNLTLTNGSLEISGDASNLPSISSGQALTLNSGGTLQTATTLNGGTLSGGNYDLDGQLTFTSGILNVFGTLQNLTSLGSGATVNMSGTSADLVLNKNLNITGGTLNIDDSASVTVGAGSIGFDSNGGNLDLSGGTLNIASMDTALALNANSRITGNGNIFGDINLGFAGTIDGDTTGLNVFGEISGSGTLADLTLFGTLNIGNSPGEINLQGVTLGAGTNVLMEILGTGAGEFDTLIGDAFTDVSVANLSIAFSSITPTALDTWALISGDLDPLSFANIITPDGWSLNSEGILSAVPEPSSYTLILGAVALAFATKQRRSQRR
jgi:hypothetical protein